MLQIWIDQNSQTIKLRNNLTVEDFFQFLGTFLFCFLTSIGSFVLAPTNFNLIVGIFVVAMILFILFVIGSDIENKPKILVSAFTGLFTGILTAVRISN